RTVRGTAAGLGALAIVAGTAACGGILGGEDEAGAGTEETQQEGGSSGTEGEDTGAEEDAGESSDSAHTEACADSETSEDAEPAGGGAADALSEDDLTAVGAAYYEFREAAAASDGEAACSLITNPDTDEPLKSGEVKLCAEGFEGGAEESPVDPSLMDAIDR